MMHPLTGVYLVTEAAYRRERVYAGFRPFRRNRHADLDNTGNPVVTGHALPRQRTGSAGDPLDAQETTHRMHAA